MKNLPLFLAFLFLSTSYSTHGAIGVSAIIAKLPSHSSQNKRDNQKFKKADLEKQLGREVKLREWIAFKIVGKKAINAESNYNQDGSGLGVAGFVLGLLGLVTFNFLFALLGVIFTALAIKRMKLTGNPDRSLAIAGLVCGIVGMVLGLAAVSFLFGLDKFLTPFLLNLRFGNKQEKIWCNYSGRSKIPI